MFSGPSLAATRTTISTAGNDDLEIRNTSLTTRLTRFLVTALARNFLPTTTPKRAVDKLLGRKNSCNAPRRITRRKLKTDENSSVFRNLKSGRNLWPQLTTQYQKNSLPHHHTYRPAWPARAFHTKPTATAKQSQASPADQSNTQPNPSLGTTRPNHCTPTLGTHPNQETMGTLTPNHRRLISTLHNTSPIMFKNR